MINRIHLYITSHCPLGGSFEEGDLVVLTEEEHWEELEFPTIQGNIWKQEYLGSYVPEDNS